MRAQFEPAGVPKNPSRTAAPPWRPPRVGGRRLDWFEIALLAVFAVISVWTLGLDLWQELAHGRVWTGTDGVYIVDQMQYLAWIRAASHHLLASNLFVLRGTPADYFQPGILVSGALVAAGVAPWLTLLLWKPVAVLVGFWGVREYIRRSVRETWPRRAALVLALFFGSFSLVYGSVGVVGDLFLTFLSWGYTFGLLALGGMLLALLAYDRLRSAPEPPSRWRLLTPALLGGLASLLHPWQGELFILVLLGGEAAMWKLAPRRPCRLGLAALTVLGTGLPLVYYIALGRLDPSWQLARVASKHAFPMGTIALALAPLALVALPAYRELPRAFLPAVTRIWPLAAIVIYALSASALSATPLHAFEGVTVPLAVLAVEGARRIRIPRLTLRLARPRLGWAVGAAAVILSTVPAAAYQLHVASKLIAPSDGNPNFITRDEHHALQYLARDSTPGGVLTRFYLGTVVPAQTGRRTFVGDCLWSQPNCGPRAQIAQMLFDGTLPSGATRNLVQATGARFVLADCSARPDMDRVLAPITVAFHRFGCARVYELAAAAAPSGALAESRPDAALRASGRQQRGVQSG
jgi:hypothetical protein